MQMRCGPLISDRVVLSKHQHKMTTRGRAHEKVRAAREGGKRVEMVYRAGGKRYNRKLGWMNAAWRYRREGDGVVVRSGRKKQGGRGLMP